MTWREMEWEAEGGRFVIERQSTGRFVLSQWSGHKTTSGWEENHVGTYNTLDEAKSAAEVVNERNK